MSASAGLSLRRLGLAALLAGWTVGCESVPGTTTAYQVQETVEIGPLLASQIERERSSALGNAPSLHLIFPANEVCRALLRVEAAVEYAPSGLMGSVTRGDASCEAIGIASPEKWRDRRPRPQLPIGGDRAQASFRAIRDTPNFALVRGRFPLASLVGWVGGSDTVALLPKTDACAGVIDAGVATIVYKAAGKYALTLDGSGPCPIRGFVQPSPTFDAR